MSNIDSFKFSVLMSVYDKEKPQYLAEALNSVIIEQSLLPNEVVLVLDGPINSNLEMVIQEFKRKAPNILAVYPLEKNMGLGKALNYGLQKCKYELVARADTDDICEYSRFESQIEVFKYYNVDILGSAINEFAKDKNNILYKKSMPLKNEEILKMAKIRNPLNHMTVMFKKSTIMKCGSYKHLFYLEDYYLWVRALADGYKIMNLESALVRARVGNDMLIRRSNVKYIKSWKKLNKFMLKEKLINKIEYYRNLFLIRLYIYIPVEIKKILYKNLLRD